MAEQPGRPMIGQPCASLFASPGKVPLMSEREDAQQVLDALRWAAGKPAQAALADLNALIPLVQGGGGQTIEVDEARAAAFLAICEVGKALHRSQPVEDLYAAAISAAERWVMVAG